MDKTTYGEENMHSHNHTQSVQQFCEENGISQSFFYKLVKQGQGPRLMKIGRRTLISAKAASEWRQDLEAESLV